jgi:hypothetical protein
MEDAVFYLMHKIRPIMSNCPNEIHCQAKEDTIKDFFAILSLFIMPLRPRPVRLPADSLASRRVPYR